MLEGLQSSLVLHLAFDVDGLLRDRAGDRMAACMGGCPLAIGGRVGDGAAMFDGTQCLAIADEPALRPQAFSFGVWASLDTPATYSNLIARPLMGTTAANNTFEGFVDSTDRWAISINEPIRSAPVTTLTWHHLAGVFDGVTAIAYVDGIEVGTMTVGAAFYADDPFLVGCDMDGGMLVFHHRGALDDVRFYTRQLSADEVATLAAM